ncbi:hypothetical protein IGI04_028992 [Brassica rapa subsp. trilocularis]|uniref:Uncharacterized protein n=1 Tax=Brassica rapa subsp. trilocularis TaxID=1813537 RepID=A0ABQ7L3I6_BRACM|nr:hypothetical protein IGI04_028992 [Brassica rapa subsp. trilocularis]
MMKQVASCLLSAKLCYELNPQVKQPQLVFNPPPAASHVQNPAEKPREFHLVLEKDQKPQAYLGEEDQLRPSSPLVCLGKLWSPSLNSSPPSTPAPLPTPSFDATPSGSSFETDPSEGSYDQTPVHMPLSPDPYFMDIEVDVVHDSPVHGDHPAAPASPAAHFPPAPAAPIPAAQPGPAPTDPAIIALLELMAEMVNLQHQALNAQREAQLEFHRLADLVERAVNVEEAIAAERDSSSHSAQPRRPSVQINPPLPLPPAKRQATAGRAYALELPGPSGPPQGPISAKLCYELNPQVKQPQLVFNPPPAASHVQNPAEKPREFHLVLEKDQKPQAYLGEEDQLRPSSPLVCLGKLWSPSLSQYLIRTVHGYLRSGPILSIQSLVHSALFKRNLSLVQASFKTVNLRRETLIFWTEEGAATSGDRIYFENLGSTIREHRPCHFRLSTIGGVTISSLELELASIRRTWTVQSIKTRAHVQSVHEQFTGRASMLICVLTWCIIVQKSVHGSVHGKGQHADMCTDMVHQLSKISTRTVHGKGQHADICTDLVHQLSEFSTRTVHGKDQHADMCTDMVHQLSKISARTVHGKGQHADMCGQHAYICTDG